MICMIFSYWLPLIFANILNSNVSITVTLTISFLAKGPSTVWPVAYKRGVSGMNLEVWVKFVEVIRRETTYVHSFLTCVVTYQKSMAHMSFNRIYEVKEFITLQVWNVLLVPEELGVEVLAIDHCHLLVIWDVKLLQHTQRHHILPLMGCHVHHQLDVFSLNLLLILLERLSL